MYLQCKAGFFEVDRYLNTPVEPVDGVLPAPDSVIVRARHRADLVALLNGYVESTIDYQILHTPQWDYEWRVYLSEDDFAAAMAAIARDLDYRNFKNWTDENAQDQHDLAYRIWNAAFDDAADRKRGPKRMTVTEWLRERS